jgi:hypothetical protein
VISIDGEDHANRVCMKDGPLFAFTNEASDLTIRFVQALPDTDVHKRLGGQLLFRLFNPFNQVVPMAVSSIKDPPKARVMVLPAARRVLVTHRS